MTTGRGTPPQFWRWRLDGSLEAFSEPENINPLAFDDRSFNFSGRCITQVCVGLQFVSFVVCVCAPAPWC